jgi:hypothetical protein
MGKIKLELDPAEVKTLAMMAENELLRMRFINPRLPGYNIDPNVFRAAQSATALLTEAMKKQKGFPVTAEELKEIRGRSN